MSFIIPDSELAESPIDIAFPNAKLLKVVATNARALYSNRDFIHWDPLLIGFHRHMISSFASAQPRARKYDSWTIRLHLLSTLETQRYDAMAGVYPAQLKQPTSRPGLGFGLVLLVCSPIQSTASAFLPVVRAEGSKHFFGEISSCDGLLTEFVLTR